MDTKNATLFGSVEVPVKLNDGRKAVAIVRQIVINDYPRALQHFGNEIALTAFCTEIQVETAPEKYASLPGLTARDLDGNSYELVQAKVEEVNQGFFKYAARQNQRAAEAFARLSAAEQEKIISAARSAILPPPAV